MSTYWKVNFTKKDLFPDKYKYSKEECNISFTECNHLLNQSPTWSPAFWVGITVPLSGNSMQCSPNLDIRELGKVTNMLKISI